MTTIAQNDWNYLKIIKQVKKFTTENGSKKLVASAECDQIAKMGQIIFFYVNTHVLKSQADDFMILKQG